MDYSDQIRRIKRKLFDLEKLDPEGKLSFGANYHRYQIGHPLTEKDIQIFESSCGITLPEDYRQFLVNVGHGSGIDSHDAGAGPNYGLYSLQRIRRGFSDDDETKMNLAASCPFLPNMSDEEWLATVERYKEDRECYSEEKYLSPFPGMMEISSQGCSNVTLLILNGSYRGKVVYADEELNGPPIFVYDQNFIDWYERWLDETIAGWQFSGSLFPGDENVLVRELRKTDDQEMRRKIVCGFFKFPKLKRESLESIESVFHAPPPVVKLFVAQLLTRHDYQRAQPYLLELLAGSESERAEMLRIVNVYAKKHADDWIEPIVEMFPVLEKENAFSIACSILTGRPELAEYLKTLHASSDDVLRWQIYYLAQDNNKKEYIDIFKRGLNDPSDSVVFSALQSIHGMTVPDFLDDFNRIIDKYSEQLKSRLLDPKIADKWAKTDRSNRVLELIESIILWNLVLCLSHYGSCVVPLLEKARLIDEERISEKAEHELELRRENPDYDPTQKKQVKQTNDPPTGIIERFFAWLFKS